MQNTFSKLATQAGQAFINPVNWERHQKTVKVGAFVVTAATALCILAIAAFVLATIAAFVVVEHHWRHGDIQAWTSAKAQDIQVIAQDAHATATEAVQVVRMAVETAYALFSGFIAVVTLWGSVLGKNVISFVRGRLLPFVSSAIELAFCCA